MGNIFENGFPYKFEDSVLNQRDEFVLRIDAVDAEANPHGLAEWLCNNREQIEDRLARHGAILFRGFKVDLEGFKILTNAISPAGPMLDFVGKTSPRKAVGDGVYVSTTYPNKVELLQHQEFAYRGWWPMKMFFYCEVPPVDRGETPLCSTKTFQRRLAPAVYRKFREKGVLYVRNYTEGLVPSWRESFETDDRRKVEEFCRLNSIQVEWRDGDRLRTSHVAQGVSVHPRTGEELWFNHALILNMSAEKGELSPCFQAFASIMKPDIVQSLLALDPMEMPYLTRFGDGQPIPLAMLEEMRAILEEQKVTFKWQAGDFVVVDNMLASHGRNPYEGERKILVSQKEVHAHNAEIFGHLSRLIHAA